MLSENPLAYNAGVVGDTGYSSREDAVVLQRFTKQYYSWSLPLYATKLTKASN